MFDNCMAYNKADKTTYWLREPCKLLIQELAQLAPTLPATAGRAEFQEVLRKLKLVRLKGISPMMILSGIPFTTTWTTASMWRTRWESRTLVRAPIPLIPGVGE